MSDTVLGWLFGGWSFGRSSDETNAGRERAKSFDERMADERAADERTRNERMVEHETDDDRLVAQVRASDAVAFETLFLRYHPRLVWFAATYVGSIESGEEVVSDVFARIWEHRATWTVTAGVSAYLFGAVRNRALDVVKHRTREWRRRAMFRDVGEAPGTAVPSIGLAEQIERDDYTAAAIRLIGKLSERQRLILSLRWKHSLEWDEIAAVLGVTSAAAQREHSRILASLRAELRAL